MGCSPPLMTSFPRFFLSGSSVIFSPCRLRSSHSLVSRWERERAWGIECWKFLWLIWIQFSSVQSLSHVWLFATPWTAGCQASVSITSSRSLLKLMSIESVMPSNHLILSSPSPAFNHSQHQGLFKWVSSSHNVAKRLEFQLQHPSFQWIFRTDFL